MEFCLNDKFERGARGLAGTKRGFHFEIATLRASPWDVTVFLSGEGGSPTTYVLYGVLIFRMNSGDFLGGAQRRGTPLTFRWLLNINHSDYLCDYSISIVSTLRTIDDADRAEKSLREAKKQDSCAGWKQKRRGGPLQFLCPRSVPPTKSNRI